MILALADKKGQYRRFHASYNNMLACTANWGSVPSDEHVARKGAK